MKTTTRTRKTARILAGSIATLLAAQSAHADNTWDGDAGGSFIWSDNVNWGANTAPGYGTLVFTGAVGNTNTLDASYSMNQVNWNSASAWTLNASGGSVLSLYDNGGTQAKLENLGSGLVTINAPVTFAATGGSNWGEINAVSGDMTFGTGTLTVNGSGVAGIRLFGAGRTTTFNNTVSAAGKYFSTSAIGTIVGIGGTFTAGDLNIKDDGVLNLNTGSSVTADVRLGNNSARSGTLNLTPAAGGLTFAGIVNTMALNTSGTLAVNSQNTSGTNTLSGQFFLDSNLRITQTAGGTLALNNATGPDLKGNTLTLTPVSGGNIAISGGIANSVGSGSLNMNGAGTVTLSGANSYTGATTVSAGVLSSNNINTWKSSVAIAAGATFNWNVTGNQQVINNAGNYTVTGTGLLLLSGGAKLDFGNSTPTIQFNMSAGGQIDVQGTNTIVEFGYGHNSMGGNLGSLNVATGASYRNSDASAVVDALTGGGVVGNAYNGTFTLTVGASNTVNNATYGVSSNTATFSGVIKDVDGYNGQGSGPTSLIKAGTGTQILSGANTYTGVTTISGGILQIGNGGTSGSLGTGNTTNNASLVFNRSDASSYSGVISGTGSVTKEGAGTQTLSGYATSYAGATTVNGGTLRFMDARNQSSTISIANGATLEFAVSTAVTAPLGDGVNVPIGNVGGTTVTGTGTFLKTGIGVLGLDANSHFQPVTFNMTGGLIDIQGGTLKNGGWAGGVWTNNRASMNIAAGANFEFWGGGSLVVDALTGAGTIDCTNYGSGQTVTVGSNNGSGTFSGVYQNTNSSLGFIKSGAGTQTLTGANTYTGVTTISGGILQIGNGGTSGSLGTGNTTNNASLVFNRSDASSYSGVISGTGSVTKEGAGTQTLSGYATSYAGATTVNGGTLRFMDARNQSSTISIANGATLEFAVSTAVTAPLGDGVNVPIGNVGGTTVTGTGTFLKTGIGVLGLDANSHFQPVTFNMTGGLIDIQGGTLKNGGWAGGVWTNNRASMNIAAGANFEFWGGGSLVVDALTGAGTIDCTNYGSGQTVTVGSNNGSGTFSGVYQNTNSSLGFIKSGTGTQTLSGANSYSGLTTISAGTLKLGATGGATNTPLGTIATGTTVSATGAALDLGGFTLGTAEALSLTGTGVSTTGALTNSGGAASYSGIVTLGAGGASIGGTGNITLTAGLFANANALTKVGASVLALNAASTRTGATTISAGTINQGANNALGTGSAALSIAPTTGTGLYNMTGVFSQTAGLVTLGGAGGTTANITTGTGTLTMGGNLTYDATNNPNGATISGLLDLGTTQKTFTIGNSTAAADDVTVSAAVSNGGGGSILKTGLGTLRLDGAQGYDTLTVNDGTTNVNGSLTTLTAAVTVTDSGNGTKLRFGSVSQTLSSLTIGAGATVIFTSGTASGAFSGGGGKVARLGGTAVVPEPGTLGLLLVGALGVLHRRRRQS